MTGPAARFGFVGAGLMGHGIALNLLQAGHALTVVGHRNRAPIDDLVARGATEAASLDDLGPRLEAVFLCLPSSREVEATLTVLAPKLAAGAAVVDVTTADPASTRRLGDALAQRGIDLVDAPVTRGPREAAAGQLISLVGASDAAFARVEPWLRAYSADVIRMGGPGAGHTAKLLNNFVTSAQVALLVDAYRAASAAGVDWAALHDAMRQGAARSGTLEKMVTPALQGDFRGHAFAVANALKDATYARNLLDDLGRPSPLAAAVRAWFAEAVAAGHGDRWCSELLAIDGDAPKPP
jgi:3-hydroxyisobutyrate dehydrogenase-like beta-hydroxyacid dehydrogenase